MAPRRTARSSCRTTAPGWRARNCRSFPEKGWTIRDAFLIVAETGSSSSQRRHRHRGLLRALRAHRRVLQPDEGRDSSIKYFVDTELDRAGLRRSDPSSFSSTMRYRSRRQAGHEGQPDTGPPFYNMIPPSACGPTASAESSHAGFISRQAHRALAQQLRDGRVRRATQMSRALRRRPAGPACGRPSQAPKAGVLPPGPPEHRHVPADRDPSWSAAMSTCHAAGSSRRFLPGRTADRRAIVLRRSFLYGHSPSPTRAASNGAGYDCARIGTKDLLGTIKRHRPVPHRRRLQLRLEAGHRGQGEGRNLYADKGEANINVKAYRPLPRGARSEGRRRRADQARPTIGTPSSRSTVLAGKDLHVREPLTYDINSHTHWHQRVAEAARAAGPGASSRSSKPSNTSASQPRPCATAASAHPHHEDRRRPGIETQGRAGRGLCGEPRLRDVAWPRAAAAVHGGSGAPTERPAPARLDHHRGLRLGMITLGRAPRRHHAEGPRAGTRRAARTRGARDVHETTCRRFTTRITSR